MRELALSEATAQSITALFKMAEEGVVIVRDGGTSLGAVISMEDFEIVRQAKVEQFLASLDSLHESMRASAEEQGISTEELEKSLDLDNS